MLFFRAYASNMKKPFELTYDPFTRSVLVLNSKENVDKFADKVKTDIELLHKAIERMDIDNSHKKPSCSD